MGTEVRDRARKISGRSIEPACDGITTLRRSLIGAGDDIDSGHWQKRFIAFCRNRSYPRLVSRLRSAVSKASSRSDPAEYEIRTTFFYGVGAVLADCNVLSWINSGWIFARSAVWMSSGD